jgi:hypothetical protein
MDKMLEQEATKKRINKTPQDKIDRASARYHAKRDEVLKMAALKNICEHGRLPFQSTIVKHQLDWEDIARCLEMYIKGNPVTDKDQKQRVIEEKREVRDFHRFISANRNHGNRDDDLTILNKVKMDAYECAMCKSPFQGKRKVMNADEATGLIRYVLCVPCSIGQVEETTIKIDQELMSEKMDLANLQADRNFQAATPS